MYLCIFRLGHVSCGKIFYLREDDKRVTSMILSFDYLLKVDCIISVLFLLISHSITFAAICCLNDSYHKYLFFLVLEK